MLLKGVQLGRLCTCRGREQRLTSSSCSARQVAGPGAGPCLPGRTWCLCTKVPCGLIVTPRRGTSHCANAFVLFYFDVLEVLPFRSQNYILRVCVPWFVC